MIADLNQLNFNSSFFAKLICRERAIDDLNDSTLYILTDNRDEWNHAVQNVQETIKQSRSRALWHLPFSIDALNELSLLKKDERLYEYIESIEPGVNLLMPLSTPDRNYKCYFIGKLEDVKNMEAAFAFLTVDAQKVFDECSFAAFATSIETSPDEAKGVWMKLIDYNSRNFVPTGSQISFRGKYNTTTSEYTFLGKGFEKMINIPRMEYSDLVRSLRQFPDTIESISKQSENDLFEKQMEYAKICQSLSAVDKNELILELAKRIQDKKVLAEAIDAVINKGKSSCLTIKLLPKASGCKVDGRRMHGDWCTFLVHPNGKKQWLDFEPAAHVIYIMNLIHRVKNPDSPSVVDVSKHGKEFIAIYESIYDGDGEEQFERLVGNEDKKSGEGSERRRLKDNYKIIINCVNLQCSFFNESPSPYITDFDKPLTVEPKLIEIPETFRNLDAVKGFF